MKRCRLNTLKLSNMASEKKKRKADKRLHWGRGKYFMKWVGKGIKGLTYFTPSQSGLNRRTTPLIYIQCCAQYDYECIQIYFIY